MFLVKIKKKKINQTQNNILKKRIHKKSKNFRNKKDFITSELPYCLFNAFALQNCNP